MEMTRIGLPPCVTIAERERGTHRIVHSGFHFVPARGGATANRGLQGCGTKALEGPERNLRRAKRGGVCISPSECTKQATRGPKRRRCGPMWQGLTGSVTGKRPVGRAYGVVCLSRCCCTHSSRWASCAHAASPVAAAAHP